MECEQEPDAQVELLTSIFNDKNQTENMVFVSGVEEKTTYLPELLKVIKAKASKLGNTSVDVSNVRHVFNNNIKLFMMYVMFPADREGIELCLQRFLKKFDTIFDTFIRTAAYNEHKVIFDITGVVIDYIYKESSDRHENLQANADNEASLKTKATDEAKVIEELRKRLQRGGGAWYSDIWMAAGTNAAAGELKNPVFAEMVRFMDSVCCVPDVQPVPQPLSGVPNNTSFESGIPTDYDTKVGQNNAGNTIPTQTTLDKTISLGEEIKRLAKLRLTRMLSNKGVTPTLENGMPFSRALLYFRVLHSIVTSSRTTVDISVYIYYHYFRFLIKQNAERDQFLTLNTDVLNQFEGDLHQEVRLFQMFHIDLLPSLHAYIKEHCIHNKSIYTMYAIHNEFTLPDFKKKIEDLYKSEFKDPAALSIECERIMADIYEKDVNSETIKAGSLLPDGGKWIIDDNLTAVLALAPFVVSGTPGIIWVNDAVVPPFEFEIGMWSKLKVFHAQTRDNMANGAVENCAEYRVIGIDPNNIGKSIPKNGPNGLKIYIGMLQDIIRKNITAAKGKIDQKTLYLLRGKGDYVYEYSQHRNDILKACLLGLKESYDRTVINLDCFSYKVTNKKPDMLNDMRILEAKKTYDAKLAAHNNEVAKLPGLKDVLYEYALNSLMLQPEFQLDGEENICMPLSSLQNVKFTALDDFEHKLFEINNENSMVNKHFDADAVNGVYTPTLKSTDSQLKTVTLDLGRELSNIQKLAFNTDVFWRMSTFRSDVNIYTFGGSGVGKTRIIFDKDNGLVNKIFNDRPIIDLSVLIYEVFREDDVCTSKYRVFEIGDNSVTQAEELKLNADFKQLYHGKNQIINPIDFFKALPDINDQISRYRKENGKTFPPTIRATRLNPVSSRSILVYEFTFKIEADREPVTLRIIDLPGLESQIINGKESVCIQKNITSIIKMRISIQGSTTCTIAENVRKDVNEILVFSDEPNTQNIFMTVFNNIGGNKEAIVCSMKASDSQLTTSSRKIPVEYDTLKAKLVNQYYKSQESQIILMEALSKKTPGEVDSLIKTINALRP